MWAIGTVIRSCFPPSPFNSLKQTKLSQEYRDEVGWRSRRSKGGDRESDFFLQAVTKR